ncbi:MAG TPA: two-component system sensor histidine kinase CreC [Thermoanaerobaculia bacterium]|nr:two-component system sensor histidine kinase CreC [Thermoanaerobaculia bacterium]HUM30743.1 two-component system sensor histidine kinase CreC [Thermoanaerobaculia bacterium]HXK68968.1 two-component system sensor histidine kinase CreC [Thermoanaerobaculia bacterium]
MKIRTRIILGFFFLLLFGFGIFSAWILNDLWPQPAKAMEDTLADISIILASMAERQWDRLPEFKENLKEDMDAAYHRALRAKIYELEKNEVDLRVMVTDGKGIVIFDSRNDEWVGRDFSEWHDVNLALRGLYGARTTRTDPGDPFSSVFHVSSPIMKNDAVVGVLTVAKPAENVRVFIGTARRNIILAGLAATLAVLLLSFLMASWLTRPIQSLTRYARLVGDGKRPPFPHLPSNEIGALGAAFEEMRLSLEGRETIEAYVQHLTHEIKGPLSSIRGAAELLGEPLPEDAKNRFTQTILLENRRIETIVDRLLQLSALENRKSLRDVEVIDLCTLVEVECSSLLPQIQDRDIVLMNEVPRGMTIRGERFLLAQAVANLLRNAIDFTPKEGRIRVGAEVKGKGIALVVEDSGVGIPDYALPRIFERFFSLNRPGTLERSTGLGLAYVREIALLHGGEITLRNRPEGGTVAALELPLEPS